MPSRRAAPIRSALPDLLARHELSWSELARRAGLSDRQVRRLRRPGANPFLAVGQRVARALGVPLEEVWSCHE
jgi:transcriptional regulator with XRE-family HTH domain